MGQPASRTAALASQKRQPCGDGGRVASYGMNTPAKPEPTPFEKFQTFTKKVLSVPKTEIDRRDAEYKKARGIGSRPRPHGTQGAA